METSNENEVEELLNSVGCGRNWVSEIEQSRGIVGRPLEEERRTEMRSRVWESARCRPMARQRKLFSTLVPVQDIPNYKPNP